MNRAILISVLSTAFLGYSTIITAENIIDSINLSTSKNTITIDSFGATNLDNDSIGYKLYISNDINNFLALEFGLISFGKFETNYEVSVGTFDFYEYHTVNFTKSIFLALKPGVNLGEALKNEEKPPVFDNIFLYVKAGVIASQIELNMDGYMYDSGNPFGPYGATTEDTTASGFYGFSTAYQLTRKLHIIFDWELYKHIGNGAKLKYMDGTIKEYKGRDVEVVSIGISYLF